MNIFYLHKDPYKAASYVYDKHKVKMILESAQMLCTAHRYYGNDNVPYKTAHLNHPSSIWVRSDALHYYWTYDYMMALGKLYTQRYNKFHLTIEKCHDVLSYLPEGIPDKGQWQDPPQCMPDEYKCEDSRLAYWNYYINAKKHIITKNETAYERIQNL